MRLDCFELMFRYRAIEVTISPQSKNFQACASLGMSSGAWALAFAFAAPDL